MAGKHKLRNIFKTVVARYHTEIANQWTSVEKRYKKLAEEHGHVNYNPRVVKPNGSDFIADVELSAKSVLTPHQYKYFIGWYLKQDNEVMRLYFSKFSHTDYMDFNLLIQDLVGAQFVLDQIHPIDEYFTAKNL